jgi:DNA-binding MarR family transcriptional regulator
MDPTETLRRLFREIGILGTEASARLVRVLPPPLTEAQFGILNHLSFTTNSDETPGDLARAFKVTRPAMTQLLGRLAEHGLVEVRPAPRDGRLRHVHLTAAGAAAHEAVFEALGDELATIAARSGDVDLEGLLETLSRFRRVVENAATDAEDGA